MYADLPGTPRNNLERQIFDTGQVTDVVEQNVRTKTKGSAILDG